MKKNNYDIEFIHEDNEIVVLNKPAGVLTIPDRYNKQLPNLKNILEEKYGGIFIVHRLDRDTSGIIVFAKNADSHRNLSMQFENLQIKKVYHCIISGTLLEDEKEVDIPLMADPANPGKSMPSVRGKQSLSIFRVLKHYRQATLVKCLLVTGRHHQIRAHCAAIGHPLLVDPLYGNSESFFLSQIKRRYNLKKNEAERPIISRITMHSHMMAFAHPDSGDYVEFTADYPKDFAALIQLLNKYSSY